MSATATNISELIAKYGQKELPFKEFSNMPWYSAIHKYVSLDSIETGLMPDEEVVPADLDRLRSFISYYLALRARSGIWQQNPAHYALDIQFLQNCGEKLKDGKWDIIRYHKYHHILNEPRIVNESFQSTMHQSSEVFGDSTTDVKNRGHQLHELMSALSTSEKLIIRWCTATKSLMPMCGHFTANKQVELPNLPASLLNISRVYGLLDAVKIELTAHSWLLTNALLEGSVATLNSLIEKKVVAGSGFEKLCSEIDAALTAKDSSRIYQLMVSRPYIYLSDDASIALDGYIRLFTESDVFSFEPLKAFVKMKASNISLDLGSPSMNVSELSAHIYDQIHSTDIVNVLERLMSLRKYADLAQYIQQDNDRWLTRFKQEFTAKVSILRKHRYIK